MSILAEIVSLLNQDPAVSGLVGGRIYRAAVADKVEAPFVVYRRVGGGPLQTSAGPAADSRLLVQIDCVGATPAQAEAVADAVRAVLDPPEGEERPAGPDCALQDENDFATLKTEGGQEFDHAVRQSYVVWGEE